MRTSEGPATIKILPPSRSRPLELDSLWEYRELLYFLAWRDIKVRYKQTAVGVAWAVLQPVLMMVVFSLFLGGLITPPSSRDPYPLFVLCGLVPWQLFAHVLVESSNSLVLNERLISKVYFPRLVVPIATVLSALLDFAVALGALAVILVWYGVTPSPRLLVLPLVILLAAVAALGVGLWLSSLNVQYRDVRYTLPFLSQLWLFATPVAYSCDLVPTKWQPLVHLNPMAGVVEGFRWALLQPPSPPHYLLMSSCVALLSFLTGLVYFRQTEDRLADII